jgi:hypothetical protein
MLTALLLVLAALPLDRLIEPGTLGFVPAKRALIIRTGPRYHVPPGFKLRKPPGQALPPLGPPTSGDLPGYPAPGQRS